MQQIMVQQLVHQPGGLIQVPSRFIRPAEERPTSRQSSLPFDIPVVDLGGLHKDHVVAEIAKACQHWGFFQVINHGVGLSLMKELSDVAHDFFALGHEEKEVNAIKRGTSVGYGRFYETSDSVANWADNLILFSYGDVQKCAQPCMPQKPERFRKVVDEYGRSIFELFIRLLELISAGLGLEPEAITKQANIKGSGAAVRMDFNYYPPCPQPDLVLGCTPHADRGVLTVLQQDGVSGLEISKDGNWYPIPPVKGAFVINVGDQIEIMSNGKYKSVLHRALANQSEVRYSFANFLMPAKETIIKPIADLLCETCPLYRPVSFGEYTAGYLFKPLEGKRQIDNYLISP